NTTTTAVAIGLRRLTSAGTPGSTVTALPWDPDTTAATATPKDTYTSTGPTITTGNFTNATLGGTAGSGIVWTFGHEGLLIPKGTSQGIALIPITGTGQICDWYMIWDE